MNARTALAVTSLLLLGACSDSSEPNDTQDSSATRSVVTGGADEQAPFTHRALAACTQAVNSSVAAGGSPNLDVLAATSSDSDPGAEQLAAWTTAYDDRLARLRGVRQILSSVTSKDDAEQAAWQIVVDSDVVEVAETEARRDLLATGDWERIRTEWPGVTASIDIEMASAEPALEQLGLPHSDCPDVYLIRPVPEGTEQFVSQVASACLRATLRRLDPEADEDQRRMLDAVATIQQGREVDSEELASLEQSLARLVAAWEQTTTDLDAVAATPIDEAAWADVLDAARERVEVYTERLEAVSAGDPQQIATAFAFTWEHPALDFTAAGVDRRGICRGVAG